MRRSDPYIMVLPTLFLPIAMVDERIDSALEMERLWERLDKPSKDIVLYLAYAAQPVPVDALASLCNASAVATLNVMTKLKRRGVVFEKNGFARGLYCLREGKFANHVRVLNAEGTTREAVYRVVDYCSGLDLEKDEKTFLLADLYKKLGDSEEGLEVIKSAADALSRSGRKTKAAQYYDHILRYFSNRMPRLEQARLFLDSTVGMVRIMMHRMPLQEQVRLLTRAHKVAQKHRMWDRAARIGLWLGRALQDAGQHKQASRYVKNSLGLLERIGDRDALKAVALAVSEYFTWKGQFLEAARRYEEVVGEREEFGDDEEMLMASQIVGFSHGLSGRISRGLGMIDAVRIKADLLNFEEVVNYCDQASAFVLLELRKITEAEVYIERLSSLDEAILGPFVSEALCDHKAYIYSLKGKYEEAFECMKRKVELSRSMGRSHNIYPWDFETLRTLESKGFFLEELNFSSLIDRIVDWDDLFVKGVALRFRAIRDMGRKARKSIAADLTGSERCLRHSGAEIELARTRIALGEHYLACGETRTAQIHLSKALGFLSTVDRGLFPDDLLGILPEEQKIKLMIERMKGINESLGTIKDRSSFLERVINAAMDFTMAMRGAFVVKEAGGVKIIASRNLDPSLFQTEQFKQVREFITGTINKGAELVAPPVSNGSGRAPWPAGADPLICMPAKLGGETIGYLCLDGRIGNEPFSEDHIPFVGMLCSQIAVGLSNISIYEELKEQRDRLEEEAVFYKREMGFANPVAMLIGKSDSMRAIVEQIQQVGPTDSSVLVLGETGVGKEIVAKAIHNSSARQAGPFIPVNLAALPHELIASELFGHEKGAFTGANERHLGRFEIADRGTIFLDEIGDLPMSIQVKLLRVLQERSFERLGGTKPIRSDFRIIAATSKNLRSEVEKGTFRRDLYYRLNVFPIYIPPLRERKDDIGRLAHHFIDKFSKKLGKRLRPASPEELRKLLDYHWPGNVRELEHFIERAVILSDGHTISFTGLKDLSSEVPGDEDRVVRPLEDVEREHIVKALQSTYWRISGPKGAASLLGLKTSTLRSRMERLGIKKTVAQKVGG